MTSPLARSTSDTARLMVGAPGVAVCWKKRVYPPNPAAGAQWAHKADGRFLTRLLAVTFTLVTSAVVANRFPAVNLTDSNGKLVTSAPAGGTVVASSTLNVFLTTGAPAYAFGAAGGTFGFLPDILVPPDYSWSSVVSGMDAGDQLSAVVLLVQRFPNDAAMITA